MARPATAAVRLLTGEREPVRLATLANIILSGLQTIDGAAVAVGDRVLVKDQADQTENGIYTASEGQWFRAADARTARTMQKGTTVHVQEGAANGQKVFCFQTDAPVIGTDAISITLYLSENTLADAQVAAMAAAASATVAASSAATATTRAVAAAGSASDAASAASAAAASATTATTKAGEAAASATAANTSKNNAATSETNAAGSATAAAGSATAASGSATTASTAATNAGASATAAAASASSAANAAQAIPYIYSTTTAEADPGNGIFRLNNPTIGSATTAYVDNQDSDGTNQTANLDTFDDSTNTVKGKLTIRSRSTAATKHVFNVTGAVVDGTGFRKLALAYIGGSGSLANAEACWIEFARSGDKGADGTGSGDVGGPASSTADNIATYNGTTGKLIKDSGVAVSSLAPKASPTFTGAVTVPDASFAPAKLDNGAAISVLGRSANSSGVRADIVAAADDTLLRRVSSAVGFGQLTTGMVPSGLIAYAMLASAAIASNSEFQLGTASKLLTASALKSTVAYQALTDAATISWDMSLGNNGYVVLAGNRTMGNPTNANPLFGFV